MNDPLREHNNSIRCISSLNILLIFQNRSQEMNCFCAMGTFPYRIPVLHNNKKTEKLIFTVDTTTVFSWLSNHQKLLNSQELIFFWYLDNHPKEYSVYHIITQKHVTKKGRRKVYRSGGGE